MSALEKFALSFVKSGIIPPPMPPGADQGMMMGGMPPGAPGGMPGGMPADMAGGGAPPEMGGAGLDLGALLGGAGGAPPGGLAPSEPPPPAPAEKPPEEEEAASVAEQSSRKVNITTVYVELVKTRKLLQGLYRHLKIPIPEDVLDDETIVAGDIFGPTGEQTKKKPSVEEPEESGAELAKPEEELPAIGGAPSVKPIEPPAVSK